MSDKERRQYRLARDYGRHEALHTASILLCNVEDYLCEHPAIKNDPEFRKLAEKAFEDLYELYQAIGERHLIK